MKLYKLSLMALALAGVMTACSDDEKYEVGPQSAGAYFPSTNNSTLTISDNATQANIVVSRSQDAGAVTYPVTVTWPSGEDYSALFQVPSSVSFAAGELSTNLVVTYNPEEIEYDTPYKFEISLPADEVSLYGNGTFSGTFFMAGPWESLGYCLYREDCITTFFNVEIIEYEVEIQESQVTPGMYRLVNPYGEPYPYNEKGDYEDANTYWVINATDPTRVYAETYVTNTSWNPDDYGYFVFSSLAYYYLSHGEDPADIEEAGYFGTLKDGVITFPKDALLIGMTKYNNGGLYQANGSGAFRIVLPGYSVKDLSASVEYLGMFTDASDDSKSAVALVSLGDDVTSAKIGILMTESADEVINAIEAGMIDTQDLTAGKDQQVSLPLSGAGAYMIGLVVYDGEEVVNVATAELEVAGGGTDNAWESLGTGGIVDAWIVSAFGVNPFEYAWEVEIQKSNETEGLYRMMNPWGQALDSPVAEMNESSKKRNIEFFINPNDEVIIMPQNSGFVYSGFPANPMIIANLEGYYISNGQTTWDELASGEVYVNEEVGSFLYEDGVIEINTPVFGDRTEQIQGWQWRDDDGNLLDYPSEIYMPEAATKAPAKIIKKITCNNGLMHSTLIEGMASKLYKKYGVRDLRPSLVKLNALPLY